MTQIQPITVRAVTRVEDAHDLFDVVFSDGVVTTEEAARMQTALDLACEETASVEARTRVGLSIMRGTTTLWRMQDQITEIIQLDVERARRAGSTPDAA